MKTQRSLEEFSSSCSLILQWKYISSSNETESIRKSIEFSTYFSFSKKKPLEPPFQRRTPVEQNFHS